MTIDAHTKISQLLKVDSDLVIKTLISLNSKFSKLKNPILRNLLVKRVSIADACKMSNTPVGNFMQSMEQIGFRVVGGLQDTASPEAASPVFIEPLDYLLLDARPILAQGKDPLKEILAAIKTLKENQGLKLINTFEPWPLIHLLANKGFAYGVILEAPDLVVTFFYRTGTTTEARIDGPAMVPIGDGRQFDRVLAGFKDEQITYLDVRDLEMPKPMLSILEQTRNLASGKALFIYHKKIPVYLLHELEKQGLQYVFKNIGPGNVNMLIYKK